MIEMSPGLIEANANVEKVRELPESFETRELPKAFEAKEKELPVNIESKNDTNLPERIDENSNQLPKEFKNSTIDLPKTMETENVEKSIEEKQEIADKAAQDYNAKTNPYERAVAKGIEGVQETPNGGVSFAETDSIYTKDDGTKCITKIEATGNRGKDFDSANRAMGLEETPEGYVWHHLDDYNVKDGTITLELVKDEAHNAAKPHSGGCAQFDAVNGPTYNPPRKGEMSNV